MGTPLPSRAWIAFACQVKREVADGAEWASGVKFNNPLNLTTAGGRIVWPAQTGTYSGGDSTEWHGDFAAFGTVEAGCWACALNYTAATYSNVQNAFKGGDPLSIAQAIQDSPWDSGHYSGTLVNDVAAELGDEVTNEEFEAYKKALQKQLEETVYGPIGGLETRVASIEQGGLAHTHTAEVTLK